MSTYVPIQAITLGTATGSIEFTNIPQTYTDLIIVVNALQAAGPNQTFFRVGNNTIDTSSLYSQTFLVGNGTSATSVKRNNATELYFDYYAAPGVSSDPNIVIAQFMNYSNINTNKTILHRASKATSGVDAICSLWRSTSAINRIQIYLSSNNFSVGATFTLYGIGSGAPKAFGGSEVRTDGTYWYHIFNSSGQFTPVQNLTVDYLVVAGGGGGGYGGGGGGGLRCTVTASGGSPGTVESPLSLSSGTAYTVTIGAGGTTSGGTGTKGGNSVFATITSEGGGLAKYAGGGNGGSGGGTGGGAPATGGTGTANQGFNGGSAVEPDYGGGGGAGQAGQAGNSTNKGGKGGNGVATSISGSSVTYGGGGGGGSSTTAGAGGTGGGGAGTVNGAATAGTANTGGGGGGTYGSATDNRGGGSGIVIVRYAV